MISNGKPPETTISVCVGVVNKLIKLLEDEKIPRTDEAKVEKKVLEMCKTLKNKEHQMVRQLLLKLYSKSKFEGI